MQSDRNSDILFTHFEILGTELIVVGVEEREDYGLSLLSSKGLKG